MIPEELKEIIGNLKAQGKMSFLESATEKQISEFEENNGLTLPEKYKNWLLFSDGGEFFLPAGIQMYGIAHKPLIDLLDEDKPDEKYVVIGVMASGDPILCEKAGEKISIYNHEAERIEDDEVYVDFYSFLKDLDNMLGIK